MTILLNISYYNQQVKFQDAPADPSEPSEPNADAEKDEAENKDEATPPTTDSPSIHLHIRELISNSKTL